MPIPRKSLELAALLAMLSTAACSVGSNPLPQNPPGTLPPCNPGTQVQLSSPLSGSVGNSNTLGSLQIVVNADHDVLGTAWNAVLLSQASQLVQGGPFFVAKAPGLFAPFVTNYYYNATLPPLFPHTIYKAYINDPKSSCQPLLVGAFST
jgi:hypothetical protein